MGDRIMIFDGFIKPFINSVSLKVIPGMMRSSMKARHEVHVKSGNPLIRGRPKPDFSVSAITETRAESVVSVSAETVTETETGAET